MRRFAIPTLLFVFALISGACAGRQVRTRAIPVPPMAETAVALAVESVPAPTPVLEPAPVVEQAAQTSVEPELTVQQQIGRYVAAVLAENDAANRAASEKMNHIRVPASPAANDEIVAALRPAKPLRRKTAPAVEDGGREAVAGSLSAAPLVVEQEPAAPAAPSILPAPAPRGASTAATAGPPKDRASRSESADIFIPDRTAAAHSRAYGSNYLFGAALAACIGILCGLFSAWRRNRRLKALGASPYDHLPDGTVLVQEIAGGVAVTIQAFPPGQPLPGSAPDAAEQEAEMDAIEHAWHADGDAIEEVPSRERPIHDRFDHTDAEVAVIPTLPPIPPIPSKHRANGATLPPASGSGQIISSSDAVVTASGVTHVPDPPQESAQPPEIYPSVIYESESAAASN